jgi:hypothetical protein
MTVPPSQPPEPALTPNAGAGCGSVLMLIGGTIMLLPGLCSLVFMVSDSSMSREGAIVALWMVCFAISALGILLIRAAARRR